MSILREFFIKISAKTDQAKLDKANQSMENLASVAGKLALGLGAVMGTSYLFKSFVDSATESGDAIFKMAKNLGIAADEMQRLQYAGNMSDISTEEMANSLKYLSKNISEASEGTGAGEKAFKRLGIGIKDSSGKIKTSTEIFKEVADSINNLSKEQKIATLMELFGRNGMKMVEVFSKGSEGIQELFERFDKLNFAISEETLVAMEEYNDRTFEVSLGMTKLKAVIVGSMLPVLTKLAETMTNKLSKAIDWVEKNQEKLSKGFEKFTKILKYIGIGAALFALGKLTIALAGVASAFAAVGVAGVLAWAKALAGPILLGGALYALYLIIDDVWKTYMNPEVKTFTRYMLYMLENKYPKAFNAIKAIVNTIRLSIAGWGLTLAKIFGNTQQQKIWEEMVKEYGGNVISSTVDTGALDGTFKKLDRLHNGIKALSSPDFWPNIGKQLSSPDFWPSVWREMKNPDINQNPFLNFFKPSDYQFTPSTQGATNYNINNLSVNSNAANVDQLARDIKTASKR